MVYRCEVIGGLLASSSILSLSKCLNQVVDAQDLVHISRLRRRCWTLWSYWDEVLILSCLEVTSIDRAQSCHSGSVTLHDGLLQHLSSLSEHISHERSPNCWSTSIFFQEHSQGKMEDESKSKSWEVRNNSIILQLCPKSTIPAQTTSIWIEFENHKTVACSCRCQIWEQQRHQDLGLLRNTRFLYEQVKEGTAEIYQSTPFSSQFRIHIMWH